MPKNIFRKKKILVAGGTGMVGQALIPILQNFGASVYVVSMDGKNFVPPKVKKFFRLDMIDMKNCMKVTKNMDFVINLLGVTGSPNITYTNPGSFLMSNLYCAVNLLYASQKNKVKRYLYTSTYGVYGESALMKESTMWNTPPSKHDKYAGWAKRIGELQIEAYKTEFNFEGLYVIRPANIYGPHVNFNPKNSMVVASLIRRILNKENPLKVWGDGENIRDFIYSEDVAKSIIQVFQKNIQEPINIGSGKGVKIKELVKKIIKCNNVEFKPRVEFDKSKKSGDKKRVLDTRLAKKYNIKNKTTLEEGLFKTIEWYKNNKTLSFKNKYNYFKKN